MPNSELVFVAWSIDDERADTTNHNRSAAPTASPMMITPTYRPSQPLACRRAVARPSSGAGSDVLSSECASMPSGIEPDGADRSARAQSVEFRSSSANLVERLLTFTDIGRPG